MRHFDEYSNSLHEGSLKKCAGKVLPQFHLHKSIARLYNQADHNSAIHNHKFSIEVNSTKQWSTLPCTNKLVSHGVGLLDHQLEMEQHYDCVKVELTKSYHTLYTDACGKCIQWDYAFYLKVF